MKRFIESELNIWKQKSKRKPLLLRGARQVGKTYSIRELGKNFKYFIEINFESDKQIHGFFGENLKADEICLKLSAWYSTPIVDGETLLFFDEIQSCIPAISSLRFFYEQRPNLHLIGAGSLLEFAMEEISSFGVGRIESLYLYPMSFDEFLLANNQEAILEIRNQSKPENPLNEAFHKRLLDQYKIFMLIGGMPEVVRSFIEHQDLLQSQRNLDTLINGFMDDFTKYKQKVPANRIRDVFDAVVYQTGGKFIYSKVDGQNNYPQLKEAADLLEKAGLIHRIIHTSAVSPPLGAGINPKRFKLILFDHGIMQRIAGLELTKQIFNDDFLLPNKGNITEQFVGLEFIKYQSPYQPARLFFWQREKKGASAEVDYIIQNDMKIYPIEVKSGTSGKMQSLNQYLKEKKTPFGIRCSMENFSAYNNIMVFPVYAVKNIFQIS